jgi:hypothetical protein
MHNDRRRTSIYREIVVTAFRRKAVATADSGLPARNIGGESKQSLQATGITSGTCRHLGGVGHLLTYAVVHSQLDCKSGHVRGLCPFRCTGQVICNRSLQDLPVRTMRRNATEQVTSS